MEKWSRVKGIEGEHGENQRSLVEISIHWKPLVNILVQFRGKLSGRTRSSVVNVHFRFTKSVLISQVDWLKILILGVEGVLVMHKQLMEDLVLKSNWLMANLMYLTILFIVVTD